VAKLLPDVNFLMAGGGDLFEETKANAPANVLLLGWVDAAEVIPVADVFLSTSLNEGVPYSLMEVQSCGIPIVAVKSGAIEEIVEHENDGMLTAASAREIASQINNLINNPELSTRIGKIAKDKSVRKSLDNVMAKSHLLLYKKVLAES